MSKHHVCENNGSGVRLPRLVHVDCLVGVDIRFDSCSISVDEDTPMENAEESQLQVDTPLTVDIVRDHILVGYPPQKIPSVSDSVFKVLYDDEELFTVGAVLQCSEHQIETFKCSSGAQNKLEFVAAHKHRKFCFLLGFVCFLLSNCLIRLFFL